MKHLVVCCDGTWNRPDQTKQGVAAPTNVAKISLALADEDDAGNPQMLHYEAGVGTRVAGRPLPLSGEPHRGRGGCTHIVARRRRE